MQQCCQQRDKAFMLDLRAWPPKTYVKPHKDTKFNLMISSNHLPHFSATYFIWVINGKITLARGHTHRIIGVMDEPLKTDKKGSRPNRDIFKQNLNMFTHTCQRMLIH